MRHSGSIVSFLVLLIVASPAQSNGGFESGLTNWTAMPAADINFSSNPDSLFPSGGNQYAIISRPHTDNGVGGGYGPHTPGVAPGEASVLSYSFIRPGGSDCEITIDWTLLVPSVTGPGSSLSTILSIDLVDATTNTLVQNVVYTGPSLPATNVPGAGQGDIVSLWAQTSLPVGPVPVEVGLHGPKRARAVITSTTTPGQMLRLDVALLATSSAAPSFSSVALIDQFRVLAGGSNDATAALRILGNSITEGTQAGDDSAGDDRVVGPIDFTVRPGQPIVIRASATTGTVGWALIAGTVVNSGTDFGFDDFNLSLTAPLDLLFDGINPSNPLASILGTLSPPQRFLEGTIPETTPPQEFGLAAIMESPAASPFFLEGTATTRVRVRGTSSIPEGSSEVVNMLPPFPISISLTDDDSAPVSLNALIFPSDPFEFYGIPYTECFVSSNGSITFGTGDDSPLAVLPSLYVGLPRIAPCWLDFDPSISPGVTVKASSPIGGPVTISWTRIAESGGTTANTSFSVQLFGSGVITMYYDALSVVGGLTGITPGGLAPPIVATSTANFSHEDFLDGGSVLYGPMDPICELFGSSAGPALAAGPNDLMTVGTDGPARITFVPSAGGYRVFCGTR